MRSVDQTTYGPDDGNCLSACVASILELPLAHVPSFLGTDWHTLLLRWLTSRGLSASFYRSSDHVPLGYSIAGGDSKRFAGRMHACVAFDGTVVFDPHFSREGLPFGVTEYIVIHGPNREVLWFSGP